MDNEYSNDNKNIQKKFDLISNLPVEVAHMIFSNLDASDILTATEVCCKWNNLINVDFLWKEKCLRESIEDFDPTDKPEHFQRFFDNVSVHWKAVYMRFSKILFNWKYNKISCKVLQSSDNVTDLEVCYLDERVMITYNSSLCINVWSAMNRKLMHVLEKDIFLLTAYAVYKDKIIFSKLSNKINVWNFMSGQLLLSITSTDFVISIHLSENLIISGCYNGLIRTYDTNGFQISELIGHSQIVRSLAYDGEDLIASGSNDTTICIWSKLISQCIFILSAHFEPVTHLKFVDEYLVSNATDGQICVWNKSNGTLKHKFINNKLEIVYLTRNRILTYTANSEVKILDLKKGNCLLKIQESRSILINGLCANRRFIMGSVVHGIKLWDISTGDLIRTFPIRNRTVAGMHGMKATETKLLFLTVKLIPYSQPYINVNSLPKNATLIDFDIRDKCVK